MTTTEKNAVIAKFLGLTETSNEIYPLLFLPIKDSDEWFAPEELKYHSDWNWLMGATIMCFKRYDEVTDDSVFSAENQQFKLNDALLETNISSLYEAVYQFVVWHNQQFK